MSKINDLIKELCPNGVEYIKLEELVDYIQPAKYIVKNTNYDIKYDVPVLTAGQTFILGYTNEKDDIYYASADNPVIIFDDFTTSNHWVDFNFKVKSSAMKILISKTDNLFKYIYYCISNIDYVPKEHSRQWIQVYSQFQIPLPPLKVQEEIVRILDKFGKLEAELEAELEAGLEARKSQYEFWCSKVFNRDKETIVTLETIGDVTKLAGFEFSKYVHYSDEGNVIALRGLNVKNGRLVLDDVKYVDNSDFSKLNRSKLYENDILYTYVGTVGQVGLVDKNDKYYLAPNVARIRIFDKKVNPKYVMHFLLTAEFKINQLESLSGTSSMKNITMTNIRKFKIPVPSLQEQERVVNILDKFDVLVNDITEGISAEIELRRQQYEYYRNKLLSFEEFLNE